ncbi:acyltransferase family protein [Nocardioides sp. Leaf374]|uniref:acyltransferase family protein n=1 Tax=Nocardioides sp. Leaf374 TaxID=2876560 RepID=UPI001E3752B1|nr:acyltransferase family protein [Nocardioides sp. Leaf374]
MDRTRTSRGPGTLEAGAPGRNLAVDVVRVSALLTVVAGHWLKQGLYVDDSGVLMRSGLLARAEWTHPLTWLLQVMPLFFLVGGYVNARSWRHARGRGDTYGTWLSGRLSRLTRPLVPLLLLWSLAAPLSLALAPQRRWLEVGSDTSLRATWFLAVYVVAVAAVPLTDALWLRWGWRSIAAPCVAVAVVDLAQIATGSMAVGALDVVLVWGTVHQLGYCWLDRRRSPRPAVLGTAAVAAVAAAVGLVAVGPWGVSMVGVSGFGLNNTYPPRLPLLLLGLAQAAVVLAVEPWLQRVGAVRGVAALLLAVGPRSMTVYLWHLTVLSLLAAGSLALGGLGLHAYPATAAWWVLRPAWLGVLVLATALVVLVLGRVETAPTHVPRRRRPLVPLAEVGVVCAGVGAMAAYGLGQPDGTVRWPLAPLTALALLALAHRSAAARATPTPVG